MSNLDELSIGAGLTIRLPKDINGKGCSLSFDSLPGSTASSEGLHNPNNPRSDVKAVDWPDNNAAQPSDDWLRAMQEIAFEMAVDQIKSTINTILQKANADCYHQVAEFLQKYLTLPEATAPTVDPIVNPHLLLQNRPFPAVGFVTGGDVSASNVWIEPLARVLKPCFPLVFVVDTSTSSIRNVHELLQWILQQVFREKNLRSVQADWLQKQLEKRNSVAMTQGESRRWRYNKRRRHELYDMDLSGQGFYDDDSQSSKAAKMFRQLTVEELLVKIVQESDELLRRSDTCSVLSEMFLAESSAHCQERLALCDGALVEKIQVYQEEMESFQRWISKLRSNSELKIRLARHLHRMISEAMRFLKAANDFVVHDSEDDQILHQANNEFIKHLKRLEDTYLFKDDKGCIANETRAVLPCCVLIFEQLESLSELENGSFIADLVRILDHFGQFRLGMVFGVKTSTSRVLRRLVLNGESRRHLDLQLFKWKNAVTCFDPIFDLLFVHKECPLFLSYNALKWLCVQYERSQSVELFVQHLKFALFLHFKSVPWSFLCLYLFGRKFPVSLASGRYARHLTIRRLSGRFGDFPMDLNEAVAKRREMSSHSTETEQQERKTAAAGSEQEQTLEDQFRTLQTRQTLWKVGLQCLKDAFFWVLNRKQPSAIDLTLAALSVSANSGWASQDVMLVEQIAFQIREKTPMRGLVAVTKLWVDNLTEATRSHQLASRDVEVLEATRKHVDQLHQLCVRVDQSAKAAQPAMVEMLRDEIAVLFVHKILGVFLADPLAAVNGSLARLLTFDQLDALESSLHLVHYDNIVDILETGNKRVEHFDSHGDNWLRDVMWCFRHYQEKIGKNLSLSDWFEQFCTQHATMSMPPNKQRRGPKASGATTTIDREEEQQADDNSSVNELHARFVRSFAVLRQFGFVRNLRAQHQNQDTIEKLVFI